MTKARAEAAGGDLFRGSLYHLWLGALSELSPDASRDASLPFPFATEAWSRRVMNTQLASWAELRHDNLLYAKESVTAEASCEYPAGYIEPYPRFFERLEELGRRGAIVVEAASLVLPRAPEAKTAGGRLALDYSRVSRRRRGVSARWRSASGGTSRSRPTTSLVRGSFLLEGPNALARADRGRCAHAADDESGIPVGKILHVGTGFPRMMIVSVRHDGGAHTTEYRGFVSSYGEATTENFVRLTDESWRKRVDAGVSPPSWLADVVVAPAR